MQNNTNQPPPKTSTHSKPQSKTEQLREELTAEREVLLQQIASLKHRVLNTEACLRMLDGKPAFYED